MTRNTIDSVFFARNPLQWDYDCHFIDRPPGLLAICPKTSSTKVWLQNSNIIFIRERNITKRKKVSRQRFYALRADCMYHCTFESRNHFGLQGTKTFSKKYILSVRHNIILHQLHSLIVRTTALSYKKRVHEILLLFIEKFQN